MGRLIALIVALAAGLLLAWRSQTPPAPSRADAPARTFSAERAMADVRIAGARPHPLGSPEHEAVAAYLLQRMTALGLSPQARAGVGTEVQQGDWGAWVGGGQVRNLVGVLPGRDRNAPAVAIMAHYDTVPSSPGAADDTAGVAAALEVVRALKAGPQPARDVMVLLTDGEEAGLLGADAFFARDPLARRVGFVINLEARGSAGRVQMFQTAPQNGAAVRLFTSDAARPSANSLSGAIYKRMPNDTDFTVSMRHGLQGLNFAFIGGQFDYHSPTATPDNLDRRTLQDMGQQALAAARAAAQAPALPAPAPDLVYGNLFGDLMLAYPPSVGWLLLAAAAGFIALGAVRARRTGALAWTETLQGAGAALYLVTASVAVLHLARLATGAGFGWFPQRWLLAHAHLWETAAFLVGAGVALFSAAELARGRRLRAALLAAAAGIGSCLLAGKVDVVGLGAGLVAAALALAAYGRPAGRPAAWLGVLVVGLLLAVAVQALEPLGGLVPAWPLLAAALAAAATALAADRRIPALAALALIGALVVGWIGGIAHAMFLGLDLVELLALPLLLAALPLWPLAQPAEGAPSSRAIGPSLMIVGAVLVAFVRFQSPWDARHPQAAYVVYHHDLDAGGARRVSLAGAGPWTDAALRADGGAIGRLQSWAFGPEAQAAPARLIPQPAPELAFSKAGGGARLQARAPAGARVLWLRLRPDTPVRLVSAGGAPVNLALKPGKWTTLEWRGAAPALELVLAGPPGAVEVRYSASTPGWPAGLAPPPPRPTRVMPFQDTDSVVVSGTTRFAW